jgi:bacterioferritin-associated ferredoxin
MSTNKLICNCKMVHSGEIERFVKKHPSATFQEIARATGASTGCGRCKELAKEYFETFSKREKSYEQLSFDFER